MKHNRHDDDIASRYQDDLEANLFPPQINRPSHRQKIYGATEPREDLCAFDAYGMDVIEGRA